MEAEETRLSTKFRTEKKKKQNGREENDGRRFGSNGPDILNRPRQLRLRYNDRLLFRQRQLRLLQRFMRQTIREQKQILSLLIQTHSPVPKGHIYQPLKILFGLLPCLMSTML